MRRSPRGRKGPPVDRTVKVSAPVSVVHVSGQQHGEKPLDASNEMVAAAEPSRPNKPLPVTPSLGDSSGRINAFASLRDASASSKLALQKRPSAQSIFDGEDEDATGDSPKKKLTIGRKFTGPKAMDPKLEMRRRQIAQEVLETEKSYFGSIGSLVSVYRQGFLNSGIKMLPMKVEVIFGNIDQVLATSRELLTLLEERVSNWTSTQKIGDVFLQQSRNFGVFTEYIKGHHAAVIALDQLEKKKDFVAVLKQIEEENPGVKGIGNLLIMPVQRMPRYVMLLMSLVEKTPENHPDYVDLNTAQSVVTKMTEKVDELILLEENLSLTYEIQKKLGRRDLVEGGHVYIKDGDLLKQCRKVDKKRWFVLFADVLIYAHFDPAKLGMCVDQQLDLANTQIADLPDKAEVQNAFQISSTQKSFIVYCENEREKAEWMRALGECIAKNHKGGEVELAPVWTPDKEMTGCTQCPQSFSVVNRRHHCRKCGALVCGKCSSHKQLIPSIDKKPVRVCDRCYAE